MFAVLVVFFTVCQLCCVATVADDLLLMRHFLLPVGPDKQEFKSRPGEKCFYGGVDNA